VGVVLNLAIWFAIHTMFRMTRHVGGFGLRFEAPVPASLDVWSIILMLGAAIAIFRHKIGMIPTLAATCAAGGALYAVGLVTLPPLSASALGNDSVAPVEPRGEPPIGLGGRLRGLEATSLVEETTRSRPGRSTEIVQVSARLPTLAEPIKVSGHLLSRPSRRRERQASPPGATDRPWPGWSG